MDIGTVGGLIGAIGGLIGLVGGAIGTYFSIRSTKGPRERQFMVRASVAVWIGVTAFLVLLFVLPNPYRWLLWIPYGLALPFTIMSLNRKQAIRLAEQEKQG